MARYQQMGCKDCKYYEAYHRHPNPLAISDHWCKKCNEEIRYVRCSPISDWYEVWLPKKCYFNDYFEESDEYKERYKRRYESKITFCQVED